MEEHLSLNGTGRIHHIRTAAPHRYRQLVVSAALHRIIILERKSTSSGLYPPKSRIEIGRISHFRA